jgi:hypothetical protein
MPFKKKQRKKRADEPGANQKAPRVISPFSNEARKYLKSLLRCFFFLVLFFY